MSDKRAKARFGRCPDCGYALPNPWTDRCRHRRACEARVMLNNGASAAEAARHAQNLAGTTMSEAQTTRANERLDRQGPELRYTNERAREMERSVTGFARLVNDDLYDLLKWAVALNQEIDRLREWIDTEGRNCPSSASVDAVLASDAPSSREDER